MAANSAECDRNIAHMGKIIDHMGEYIQCIAINADMGTQASPFASPALVEQVTAPFLKRFCSFVHENSNIKVFLHSCGSIEPLIPILIEAGIDVLNPVQISANNMNPQNLVDKYGGKIVFWGGGCDTQHVLGVATPAKVAENVRESVGIFKRTSGYVFNQVHNIMGDVPPENIIAMLETAYKESFY